MKAYGEGDLMGRSYTHTCKKCGKIEKMCMGECFACVLKRVDPPRRRRKVRE